MDLKSSMERFIDVRIGFNSADSAYLKSSMERFIVCSKTLHQERRKYLKSSMERFIASNENICINIILFKIQYGEIYSGQ